MQHMRLMLLAVLLVGGCGMNEGGLEPLDLAEARDAVWAFYGRTDVPPRVRYEHELNCNGTGFTVQDQGCAIGAYLPDDDEIVVAGPSAMTDRLETVAHEAWHAVQQHKTGNLDHEHRDAAWRPGGAVSLAHAMLKARAAQAAAR